MCEKYLNWLDFNNNQEFYNNQCVKLCNADFLFGTLRIRVPCKLVLLENIIFNPDNGDQSNWFFEPPKSINNVHYINDSYKLGFFTALAIESSNVIIDLNNFEIKQSYKHFLLQRFFSIIELASAPFIPNQGPANFGNTIKSATHVTIINGTLGLSSHHGIHGNNNTNITIDNICIKNFEICGIGLNNAKYVKINNVNIGPNVHFLPVISTFSSAIFTRHKISDILKYLNPHKNAYIDLSEKLHILELSIVNTITSILENNNIDICKYPELKIYQNTTGFPDGTTYGILINNKGVAVNGFLEKFDAENNSTNITIENVLIHDIIVSIKEIPAIINNNNKPLTGLFGDLFQISIAFGENIFNKYKQNPLSNILIALSRWSFNEIEGFDPDLVLLKKDGHLGTFNISPYLVPLLYDINTSNDILLSITSNDDLSNILSKTKFTVVGNSDSMFHVIKGLMGIRLDGVINSNIYNVKILNVYNYSSQGAPLTEDDFTGPSNGGHPNQNITDGYSGTNLYAIVCSSCKNINMNIVYVELLKSIGPIYAVQSFYENTNITTTHFYTQYKINIDEPHIPTTNFPIKCPMQSINTDISHSSIISCPVIGPLKNKLNAPNLQLIINYPIKHFLYEKYNININKIHTIKPDCLFIKYKINIKN
jgi:hypothetical protein